jgi:hypothetical protein
VASGLGLVLALAALARPAAATTADDLCTPTVDPCRVIRPIQVTPASEIDFGTRTLIIVNRGALDLQGGTMTLRAGALTVETGGALLARGSAQDPGKKIVAEAGQITLNGTVDASGAPGGVVMLTSTGSLIVAAAIDVRSRGSSNGGGSAELQGVDISIASTGRINALGGGDDFGGDIDIAASGALSVAGNLEASGGEGGIVTLNAGGALSVASTVTVKADATSSGGSGGEITVSADGIVTLDGQVSANGRNGSADTGAGDGGNVDVTGSAIVVPLTAARISTAAGSPDGVGGDIDLSTTTGAIDCQGRVEAPGPGVDGTGGSITLDAVGALSVGGTFNASGGRDGGGAIDLLGGGDLVVTQTASLSAAAGSSGDGGDIDADVGGDATIRGEMIGDGGPTEGGNGGSVTVSACAVRVESTARLSSLRTGGTNILIGRDSTLVAGQLRADVGSGRNVFRFPGPEYEPAVLPGAEVTPSGTFLVDSTLLPCNPVDTRTPTITRMPTATHTVPTTRTPTSTSTRGVTVTPTATPVPCVGDCDGSGVVTVSDLVTGVNIVLDNQPITRCPAFDPDDSGTVTISELIQGVNNTLNGCS